VPLECPKVEIIRRAMLGFQQLLEEIWLRKELDRMRGIDDLCDIYGHFADCPPESFAPRFVDLLIENQTHREAGSNSAATMDFVSQAQYMITNELVGLAQLLYDETSKSVMNNSFASLVPARDNPGRILRHETHPSREIERTLSQLDRLQRERLGHASSPISFGADS